MNKKVVFSVLTAILFSIVIYFLFKGTDFNRLFDVIKQADLGLLVLGLFFLVLKYVFSAFRFYFATYYFNKFDKTLLTRYVSFEFKVLFKELLLPIPNSEDIFRFLFLRTLGHNRMKRISTLLYVRLSGIFIIAMILFFSLSKLAKIFPSYKIFEMQFFVLGALVVFVILLVTNKWVVSQLTSALGKLGKFKVYMRLYQRNAISALPFSVLALLSILHFGSWAIGVCLICSSMGMYLSLLNAVILIPAMVFSFMIPLSYQGLGLPETSMMLFLVYLGFSQEMAGAASLMHFFFYALIITSGAILTFLSKDKLMLSKK